MVRKLREVRALRSDFIALLPDIGLRRPWRKCPEDLGSGRWVIGPPLERKGAPYGTQAHGTAGFGLGGDRPASRGHPHAGGERGAPRI